MRDRDDKLARRSVLAGAGTAGALAAAAALMPGSEPKTAASKQAAHAAADDSSGGYRLTEHIRKYYRAARV